MRAGGPLTRAAPPCTAKSLPGTATADEDYNAAATGVLTFATGAASASLIIGIVDDFEEEPTEQLAVRQQLYAQVHTYTRFHGSFSAHPLVAFSTFSSTEGAPPEWREKRGLTTSQTARQHLPKVSSSFVKSIAVRLKG